MHELGIAQDFWSVAKSQAEQHGLKKITRITIVVGEASGFEIDFLRHSLKDHILPGTIGANAVLDFIAQPLEASCNQCGSRITKDSMMALNCPHCSSADIRITSGKDSYVQSIEGE